MVSISHLLNRKVLIKRNSDVSDGQGGFTTSLVDVATEVPSRRHAPSGGDRFVAGREEAVVTHIWYFEFEVDVRDGDTIVDENGTKYEVLRKLPPSLDDFLKIQTREFQHG